MIKLVHVSHSFGKFDVLQDVDLEIKKKDFVLVAGHNGSGKTTLFDIISGRLRPDKGQIFRDGRDITAFSEKKRARFVGRVFQNTMQGSVRSMSLAENLAMAMLKTKKAGLRPAIKNFPSAIVGQLLSPLGLRLEELLHVPIGQLSGGQRQIITIIMATLCRPDLLLLDEPTAALDPVSTQSVLDFLRTYTQSQDMAALMITHDLKNARPLASHILTLAHGKARLVPVNANTVKSWGYISKRWP